MKSMSAQFTAEAATVDGDNLRLEQVAVYMETDGVTVAMSRQPIYWGARDHKDGAMGLTPVGWQQAANHAQRLVREANEAWARMQAEK